MAAPLSIRRIMPGAASAMMAAGAMLAAVLAGIVAATELGVPVDIIDRRQHFEVRAVDAAGLGREIAERGPQHPTGQRAWAYTAWELRARYTVEPGPHGCRLLDPAVVLEVVTTLPHWRPAGLVRARLRSSWARMLVKATEHESVHRQHGIDAARAAAVEIAGIARAPQCAEVERRVRTALRRASTDATRRSRLFDRETDYGRRAGVRLED